MTIAADNTKNIANGNDVATVFNFTFKINFSTDLVVVKTDTSDVETILTEGVHYSVTGVGADAGGSITYPLVGDPLPTGEKVTMYRVPAIKQLTDLINQGGYYPQTVENALDLLTMIAQMTNEAVNRSIKLDVSDESGADLSVPSPVAGTVLGWNSLANALINVSLGSVSLALPASDSIVAAMINAAGTQATLDKLLSGNIVKWQKGADVPSAAGLVLGSDGNIFDVTGVTAITSIGTVAVGTLVILQFDGILTLTHHATDLILPGAANITTAAGDHAIFYEYAAGDWRCLGYFRASSLPVLLSAANTISGNNTFSGSNTFSGNNTFNNAVIASGGIILDGTNTEKKKTLVVGAWNMDTASNVDVAHGLSEFRKIRAISATIRSDDNTNHLTLPWFTAVGQIDAWIQAPTTTNVQLTRRGGGFFDSVNYDLTQYTLDNAAAVDKGDGTVGIPITAHTFLADDVTTIAGTTNYNGTFTIVSVSANEIVITASYVAETFAGTETASWSRGWIYITYFD